MAKAYNVEVGGAAVCPGHSAPIDFLEAWVYDRPPISLVHGPRGGGKSYLRGFAAHLDSLQYDLHDTQILGGSEAQSRQIYNAVRSFAQKRFADTDLAASVLAKHAEYSTGSSIAFIPASSKSVRGPHVASLCLDEVDEIEPDYREAALGMCMGLNGIPGSVSMTSTWHRVAGPMAELIEKGESGAFPVFRFCAFEVLEPCPEERSGPFVGGEDLYLNCPECPIRPWCHEDVRPLAPGLPDEPKAKRSRGHYPIDSLTQKVVASSPQAFLADYLSRGPKPDGIWFRNFDADLNQTLAEFDPRLDLYLPIDSGVFSGAVFFQILPTYLGGEASIEVRVLQEYLSEDEGAEQVAASLREVSRQEFADRVTKISTDSASDSRNAVGERVVSLYRRGGLWPFEYWPKYPGSVADSLALIDSLILSADGHRRLLIHPRCKRLIAAIQNYRRAKRGGQWQDYPEDPQHPHEDLIDALRGGLALALPKGLDLRPTGRRVPVRMFT